MIHFTEPFEAIERDFVSHGIPVDIPGFYDDPSFIAIEKLNPSIIDNYARYVYERPRSPEYDMYARKVVPLIAREYHMQLKKNGRYGACVDISGLISRALEREGVWNTIVKGALTINFPLLTRIKPSYYWPIDNGVFTAGHAWVVAPPFFVVDVAVQLQPYEKSVTSLLPEMVCDEAVMLTRGAVEDLISPEVRKELSLQGVRPSQHLQFVRPDGESYLNTFHAREIVYKGTTLKYVFFGSTAPDTPFEEITSLQFEGKSGFDIYNEIIRPALATAPGAYRFPKS